MKLVSFLLSGTTLWMAQAQSTIPCPGFIDPSNFTDVPLSERPNLDRILRNGFDLSLNPVGLPTTTLPGNPIEVHKGFIDRPFRTLDAPFCSEFDINAIQCGISSSADLRPNIPWSYRGFVEDQALFQVATRDVLTYPTTNPAFPDYTEWESTVTAFLQSEPDCGEPVYTRNTFTSFSCTVAAPLCQVLDPEFVADVVALPINMTSDGEIALYQAFNNKWGYGSVEGVRFGAGDMQVKMSNPIGPTLVVGRAGGMGDLTDLAPGEYYTNEDCQDPAPVDVDYQLWHQLFNDRFFGDTDIPDLDARQFNFLLLFLSYPTLSEQAQSTFTEPECISPSETTAVPSLAPTRGPTLAPTTSPTMTPAAVPSSAPTRGPTLAPTTSPTMTPAAAVTAPPSSLRTRSSMEPTDSPTPDDSRAASASSFSRAGLVVLLLGAFSVLV